MKAPQSPIRFGFGPREISSLHNLAVIAEHASEAGFLWSMHRTAAGAPHYTLAQLAGVDERLLAHLAGLQLAGSAGWRAALSELGGGEPGAVFTAAYLAYTRQDLDGMRHTLGLATGDPEYRVALVDSLAWIPTRQISWSVKRLLASQVPQHRWIGCAALGAHRSHDIETLETLLGDTDPAVRARALQAVGENKQREFLPLLAAVLRDPDTHCGFWAAWSAALMGDVQAAQRAFEIGYLHPEMADKAIEVAMRCAEPGWARSIIRLLAAESATRREAILAVAALGDPVTLPWLIEMCADPQHAPLAGGAISMITGADLALLDLDADWPEHLEPAHPDDANYPFPNGDRIAHWWVQQAPQFAAGRRYLGGKLVSAEAAKHVLRSGHQRQRAAAALELSRIEPARPLYAVDARGDWQLAGFAS